MHLTCCANHGEQFLQYTVNGGWNMGQTNDPWNQRSIYDVETPIPSHSKEMKNNATGKEEQGNCLFVLWKCICDEFNWMSWHCITVKSYCSKLERLQQVICYTQPGMLHQHVINLYGKARPHNAYQTSALLQHYGWEVTDNPQPNSPILMTSNFHLHLKHLHGEQFATDTEVK
jgi:hypothetical protein